MNDLEIYTLDTKVIVDANWFIEHSGANTFPLFFQYIYHSKYPGGVVGVVMNSEVNVGEEMTYYKIAFYPDVTLKEDERDKWPWNAPKYVYAFQVPGKFVKRLDMEKPKPKFDIEDKVGVSMGWAIQNRYAEIPSDYLEINKYRSTMRGYVISRRPVMRDYSVKIEYCLDNPLECKWFILHEVPEDALAIICPYKKGAGWDSIKKAPENRDIIESTYANVNSMAKSIIDKAIENLRNWTPPSCPDWTPDYNTIMNMHLHKTEIKKNESEGKEMIKPDESNVRTESFAPLSGEREALRRLNNAFTPVQIIFNPPATIVFWKDGTKTVVKCEPNETFNKYHGYCAAVCKKMYNSNSALNKMIASVLMSKEAQEKLEAQKVTKPSCEQKPAVKPQKGIHLKEDMHTKAIEAMHRYTPQSPKKKSPVKKGSKK